MPVIQAISGNTGLQSVTMVVRGLATGQVPLSRWWEPLRRQVQTSSILGGVCALVVGSVGLLWHSPAFGLVVALSMFASVNLSGFAGTMIPMLSKRLGFDPAITAGPFETALQDVLGVTIFLSLATALLRWIILERAPPGASARDLFPRPGGLPVASPSPLRGGGARPGLAARPDH